LLKLGSLFLLDDSSPPPVVAVLIDMMILLLAPPPAVIKGDDENTYHQQRRCRMQCAAFYELRRGVEEAPALSRVEGGVDREGGTSND
jgi:hypothetical protein